MQAAEIQITVFYSPEGDDLQRILQASFAHYVRLQLQNESGDQKNLFAAQAQHR